MDYQTIDEIYAANGRVKDELRETLAALNADEVKTVPEGEKWSIEQIVEHISMVEEGTARICRKLLTKARAEDADGTAEVVISEHFKGKAVEIAGLKVEAPEIVQPTGTRSVEDSLAKTAETQAIFEEIRPLFKLFDGTERKFRHPFFGAISAASSSFKPACRGIVIISRWKRSTSASQAS